MIKVFICCRDKETVNGLVSCLDERILEDHFIVTVYNALTSSDEIASANILFIEVDADINGLSGVEFTKELLLLNPTCRIIFIDDCNPLNERIYEVDHIYLLQKPLKQDSIDKALNKALHQLENVLDSVLKFYANNVMHFIPLKDIVYLEKNLRKIIVHTYNGIDYSFYSKFDEIEPMLSDQFLRCHNGIIINLTHVVKMHTKTVQMGTKDKTIDIPVSRTYSTNVKQIIQWYIKNRESYQKYTNE